VTELQKRIFVAIPLIAVATFAIWVGGIAFWVLAVIAGLLMIGEWADLAGGSPHRRIAQYALCIPLAIMAPIAAGPSYLGLGFIAGAALFLTLISRNLKFALGAFYIGVPIMALLWVRALDEGLLLAFWALALVWATDIGAYFAGRSIGGPKIAPSISPNKTWAGLIGGMSAALAFGLVLQHYFALPTLLAVASPILAILAQAGDFFESWLKRKAGVKDSGTLLPGHGGALDRLDGVISSVPFAALFIFLVVMS
jgi:phosphatidate cytidylyltransferase